MDNLNTRDFLERRRRELEQQLSALHGQMSALRNEIEAKKSEIGEIDRAIAAIGPLTKVDISVGAVNIEVGSPVIGTPELRSGRYDAMTIKELIVQALLDHFPEGGSSAEIREFIKNAYGREIEQSTLRPQLHRLKEGEAIEYDSQKDVWKLVRVELSGRARIGVRSGITKRRPLYSSASSKKMKDLE